MKAAGFTCNRAVLPSFTTTGRINAVPPFQLRSLIGPAYISTFLTDSGSVAGPAVIGILAEVLTLGTAAVAIADIGMAGAGVMLLLVKETLQRRRSDTSAQEEQVT